VSSGIARTKSRTLRIDRLASCRITDRALSCRPPLKDNSVDRMPPACQATPRAAAGPGTPQTESAAGGQSAAPCWAADSLWARPTPKKEDCRTGDANNYGTRAYRVGQLSGLEPRLNRFIVFVPRKVIREVPAGDDLNTHQTGNGGIGIMWAERHHVRAALPEPQHVKRLC